MRGLLKSAFGSVLAVVIFFAAVSVFSVDRTRKMIVSQADESVRNLVKATTGKIDQLMSDVETAVSSQGWIIRERMAEPDYMYKITRELVGNYPFICGSTVAFRSGYYPEKGHFWAPYTFRNERGELENLQLGTSSNDYFQQEWYFRPLAERAPTWSEPYFDVGGGKVWMSTYSMPIFDATSNICAVFTADLSLEHLMNFVAEIRPYENSYVIMKAADKILVGKQEDEAKRSGKYIGKILNIEDRADNGWSIEIGCPIEEIMRGPQKVVNRIIIFSALGLFLILGLSVFYNVRLQRSVALRERIAGELDAARNIQAGVLPNDFSDDIFAVLRPAREVGGDLYDFVRRGDQLYFIVGDASGKGVPAALFSFMAVTVFRMACGAGLSPSEIIDRINQALAHNNEMSMFVTAFVGALNLTTGELEFSNAGHNPPIVISPEGSARMLSVHRAPPVGVDAKRAYILQRDKMSSGSRLLVYTDGVTEAERTDHAQFGDARLLEYASRCANNGVREVAEGLLKAVDGFVDGAEQFDDITILTVRCGTC